MASCCLRPLVTSEVMLTLTLVRRRGGFGRTEKARSMPLNASFELFLRKSTVLLTRLPAAQNPLRIPKVLHQTLKEPH